MSKYSKKITARICKLIRNGVFNKDAAKAATISETTFYRWMKEKREFRESIKKAEMQRKCYFILAIAKAAVRKWQAAAWYLERVYPEEFAKKEVIEARINPQEEMKKIDEKLKKKWEIKESK